MATLEEIVVQLSAETSQLRAEMQNASKIVKDSTEKMASSVDKFSKDGSKSTSVFQTAIGTMTGFLGSQAVLGAFGYLKDAAGFLFTQLEEGISAANAQEDAMRRLGQSLALNGNYTEDALTKLMAFTDEMERITGVGDDVVASNLAVLSSLTKLDSEGLQKAQASALNMSAALGIDLDSATRKVALAINGSDTALKKYGVSVDVGADKTRNLGLVVDALDKSFGGAAEGKMKTFAGALTGLKNSWGNLFEEIANAITSNQVIISVIGAASQMLSAFTKQIQEGGTAVRDGIGAAFIEFIDVLQSVTSGVSTFFKVTYAVLSTLQTGASVLINGFMALGWAIEGNLEKAGTYLDNISASADRSNKAIGAISEDGILDKAASKLGELKTVAQSAFDEMITKPQAASLQLENAKNKVAELTAEQIKSRDALKDWATGLSDQNLALNSSLETRKQLLDAARGTETEDQAAYFEEKMALQQEQFVTENAQLQAARNQNLITEAEYQAARTQLDRNHAVQSAKSAAELVKFQNDQDKARQENFKSTMGTIASLSSSGNKELAAIGKAAAITNATIDGYAAVQKALASAPPPFNFALAAAVGAATAANVSKIAGVSGFKNGIDSVPNTGLGSGDTFPAMLSAGERVVPTKTNEDLTNFLAKQQSGTAQSVTINVNIGAGTGMTREQVGEVVEAMNNYFSSGGNRLVGAV
jgi:hypothetical protein